MFAPRTASFNIAPFSFGSIAFILCAGLLFESGLGFVYGFILVVGLNAFTIWRLFNASKQNSDIGGAFFLRLCVAKTCKWVLFSYMLYISINYVNNFSLLLGVVIGQAFVTINNFLWLKH